MFTSRRPTALLAVMWLVIAAVTAIVMIGGTEVMGGAVVPFVALVVAPGIAWA
jgi:hypothetical protein